MPRRDKTGPMGSGAMTGRGFGLCADTNPAKCGARFGAGLGLGLARRRGFGRGFDAEETSSQTRKERLLEQKNALQSRLNMIDQQLASL